MVHEVLEHHHHDDKGKKVKCLSCGSPYEGFFCFDCHSLLSFSGDMDYFAMLQVEKRPVVDTVRLKENFLRLSEYLHPDKYYNSSADVQELALKSSSLLNKAYSTLKDPKERIRYLISLESDREAPVSKHASAETMEFFIEASDVCAEIDKFSKKEKGDETLRQVHLRKLNELKKEAADRWEGVLKEIAALDKEWLSVSGENKRTKVRRLIVFSHEISYLSKLQSLIDELIVAIS